MWLYNDKEIGDEDIEGYVSFVYRITNLETGKKYIGKKVLKTYQKKKVKGKTRKKKVEKESKWREYFGSNLNLLADVEKLGRDKFKREILKFREFLIKLNTNKSMENLANTDLYNVRDEILGDINQFLYLLTFK